MSYVRVPKEELLKLEEARIALYVLLSHFPDDLWFTVALLEISNQMWRVANTKYWYKGDSNERLTQEDQEHFT